MTGVAPAFAIGVVARDFDACARFYEEAIGLRRGARTDFVGGYLVAFESGGTPPSVVKIVLLDDIPEPANPPGGLRGGRGFRYITLRVADLEGVVAACVECGGSLLEDGVSADGSRLTIISDPEGNVVECKSI